MKNILNLLILLGLAFCFQANAKKGKKKIKFEAGNIKITDKPSGKTFRVLKYRQLERLEYASRVKYINFIRKSIRSVDSIQKSFGFRYSSIVEFDDNKMFASKLFVNSANAATQHDRGGKPTDGCVASGNLTSYKSPGRYNPFGCKSIRCPRASSTGQVQLKCGFILTGLSGDNGCVPKYNTSQSGARRHSPTEDCWEKSQKLYRQNRSANSSLINTINKQAQEMKGKSKSQIKAWLNKPETKTLVRRLKSASYDPRAFAHLVGMTQTYRDAGVQFPVETPEAEWNTMVKGIDAVLADYKAHCDKKLTTRVVNDINSGRTIKMVTGWARTKEKIRIERARELLKTETAPTVRNVLQVPECKNIDERITQLKEIPLPDYPIIGNPDPVTPVPPPPPTPPEKEIVHLGCTDTARVPHHMPQMGMRCVACAAERAVINTTGDEEYYVSRKWLSLLSTMALVCGDGCMGTNNDVHVTPAMAQEYVQSFGHCDDSNYSWLDSNLTPSQERLVEKWGTNGGFIQYMDRNKNNTKKINDDFYAIYGAPLDDLIPYFCNMENHSSWSKSRERCSGIKSEGVAERVARRRQGLRDMTKGTFGQSVRRFFGLDKPKSATLKQCLHEAYENMQNVYTGPNAKCMGFSKASDSRVEGQFAQQSADANGNFAENDGNCAAPKQIEYERTPSNRKTRIVWTDSSRLNQELNKPEYLSPMSYYELNSNNPGIVNRYLNEESLSSRRQGPRALQRRAEFYQQARNNTYMAVLNPGACGESSRGSGSGSSSRGTR